jgi:GNAT superfamily N-acetyltransferase
VAEQHGEVVGLACVGATSAVEVEVGLVVQDEHQGLGVGSRLLREVALDAAERGYADLVCVGESDNTGLLPTVRRAGLRGVANRSDGVVEVWVPLAAVDDGLPRPA